MPRTMWSRSSKRSMGTSGVDLVGGAEQEIQVNLDTGALEERGLPADAVVGAISAADANAPRR